MTIKETTMTAIARESLNISVIDSREKRIFFINEVVRELGLGNVKTFIGRAEDSNNGVSRNSFDCVLTRAVGDIESVLNLSSSYINDKGKIILMRGKEGKLEWGNYENKIYELENLKEFNIPGTDLKRVLLSIKLK